MDDYLYSVIIPVYNAENSLDRCLISLLKANRTDVQIILINDGSVDNSEAICKKYASTNPNVFYMYQKNQGVSSARNKGIGSAKGKYILFVDSDDYVADNYFSSIDELVNTEDCDLGMFQVRWFGKRDAESQLKDGEWRGTSAVATICTWMREKKLYSLWSKVFRKELIKKNNLQFDESISISEDVCFVFLYCLHANCVKSISKTIYCVSEENDNSLSRQHKENLGEKLLTANRVMMKGLGEVCLPKEHTQAFQKALCRNYYRSAYSAAKQLRGIDDAITRRDRIKDICTLYGKDKMQMLNIENFMIALPVKLKFVRLIDLLVHH